jgi:hypothetical protein
MTGVNIETARRANGGAFFCVRFNARTEIVAGADPASRLLNQRVVRLLQRID